MLRSGNGDIHSSIITNESEALIFIGPYTREDNDVFLSALERINSINLEVLLGTVDLKSISDELKKFLFQKSHLTFVRRYYTNWALQSLHRSILLKAANIFLISFLCYHNNKFHNKFFDKDNLIIIGLWFFRFGLTRVK